MSIVQHTQGTITTSTNFIDVTFASLIGKGNLVVAEVLNGNNAGGTVPSGVNFSDASAAFTICVGSASKNGTDEVETWFLASAPASKQTVRVSFPTNTATDKQVVIYEVSGFTNPTYIAAAGTGAGASSGTPLSPIVSVNPVFGTSFIVAGIITTGSGVTANPRVGNEFTSGGDTTGVSNAACSLFSSRGGKHQAQWTTSAATFTANIVAFVDLPAAPVRLINVPWNALG